LSVVILKTHTVCYAKLDPKTVKSSFWSPSVASKELMQTELSSSPLLSSHKYSILGDYLFQNLCYSWFVIIMGIPIMYKILFSSCLKCRLLLGPTIH